MKKLPLTLRVALRLALGVQCARAAATDIATVPVMNITGTGSVKPNILLMMDNSGSMDWAYVPDYVGGATSSSATYKMCRTGALLSNGTAICTPGDPPFMSAAFNGMYYNPTIYYQPPVKADSTSYSSMTAANTTNWTRVPTDGYNVQNNDMFGNNTTTTDLTAGFPDKKWCNSSPVCQINQSYFYPDANFKTASTIYGNAYYYNIHVQEYCTDASLKVCTSVLAGSAAP